jgi:hypothetical protein
MVRFARADALKSSVTLSEIAEAIYKGEEKGIFFHRCII